MKVKKLPYKTSTFQVALLSITMNYIFIVFYNLMINIKFTAIN